MMPNKNYSPLTGNDPYFREDPGTAIQMVPVYTFDIENEFSIWKAWRTNDGRVLPNNKCSFDLADNPFGYGSLIKLTTFYDPAIAGKAFGGFGIRAPVNPPVTLNNQTYVQFDLYFPASAVSKYMRFEVWSTSSGGEGFQGHAGYAGRDKTQVYIRFTDKITIREIDSERIGFLNGETWYKRTLLAVTPISTGIWEYLNIDLHTENGTKVNNEILMIGGIKILQADENRSSIPKVVNEYKFSEVAPIKSKYNEKAGNFLIGTTGKGFIEHNSIGGYHFEIFTDEDNLKPETHERPPQWLRDKYPNFVFKPSGEGPEWNIQTNQFLSARDSGKNGEYKLYGQCLAWVNQSPFWMRQIIPKNISSMEWNPSGLFYLGGTNSIGPYQKVDKNTARRIYFDHIVYLMRHFMTTDTRYKSGKERGIIPFYSFEVVNVELHDSRHGVVYNDNPDKWDTALRHLSWLMAMTDDDFGNIRQHYIYLLFKFAHIAVPNAQMAEKYKAGYNDSGIVPEYMKMDNHDNSGSIDSYITERPPFLVFNDYEFTNFSKAKIAYNMIKELNTAWKTDPLYDGRNLIEFMGIQGHEIVNPSTTAKSRAAIAMFASLIDDGLLDAICYTELDIRQSNYSPGGQALAPAVLNLKQADSIGYQYALMFKLFEKYKKYIDHVTIWGSFGSGLDNAYVLFDLEQMASQAYYAIMEPDRFIKGHSYLDEFFAGEYDKLKDDDKPD